VDVGVHPFSIDGVRTTTTNYNMGLSSERTSHFGTGGAGIARAFTYTGSEGSITGTFALGTDGASFALSAKTEYNGVGFLGAVKTGVSLEHGGYVEGTAGAEKGGYGIQVTGRYGTFGPSGDFSFSGPEFSATGSASHRGVSGSFVIHGREFAGNVEVQKVLHTALSLIREGMQEADASGGFGSWTDP
jgi:hypothetical protein